MLVYILFVIGFVFLVKGANFLVQGAGSLAKKIGVSDLVIGLTIVAFGTSAPEIVVNVIASIKGTSGLVIGNVLGSNISNVFLVLGAGTIIFPLVVKKGTAFKEIPFSLLAILVLGVLANDFLIDGSVLSIISRVDGIVLLSFFIIFLYYVFSIAKENQEEIKQEIEKELEIEGANKVVPLRKSISFIILGLAGLILGGQWIVNGAVQIAQLFNISETVIGLTIVAIGTSLPELATVIVAAWKKSPDIALGNIVGSNIFNIFLIVGISAIINPISFDLSINRDIIFTILSSLILFAFVFIGKKYILQRYQGVILVGMYVFYIGFLLFTTVGK